MIKDRPYHWMDCMDESLENETDYERLNYVIKYMIKKVEQTINRMDMNNQVNLKNERKKL